MKGDIFLVLLPYLDGFFRSGEKVSQTTIFVCNNCGSKRTVKSGKTIPKCSKCNDYTYWFKIVTH
ncbi:zinc ribbon-containing protein [Anaerobutyricum hallii]|uniref:zinc ribbon-containing protein n=1 Tax=Anaerobutyricum hallii TaxID=39488 RepID=UPI003AB92D5B